MYAMVEIQGGQYKAAKGEKLTVDLVAHEKGDVVEFDNVLMIRDDKKISIGEPYVKGAKVKAVVEDHIRDSKVLVYKYKRRKRYKRLKGHRQHYTILRVEEISAK